MASDTKSTNIFWPRITDAEGAANASDHGYVAALIVAGMTALFATIAVSTGSSVAAIDGWAFVDALLFGVVAWRIKKRSRAFAVAGAVLFALEKAYQFISTDVGSGGAVFAAFLLMFFVTGVRGTFALHKFTKAASGLSTTTST